MERLKALLNAEDVKKNRGEFVVDTFKMRGNIPVHYKRLNVSDEESDRLAKIGAEELFAAYEFKPYYTQAVIAGGILSGDYDTVVVVTCTQYGKSMLMGHVAPMMAFKGESLTVAGATAGTTEIIMTYTRQAIRTAMPDIKDAVVGESMKKIDRLDSSMSKGRISFAKGGYINSITLGDMYTDITHNKAVGIGTGYIIDEAANVSEAALSEVYRREMARVDGGKNILVMISNPHKPGAFYDALTKPDPDDRTLIVWMDVLTAVQEGRWTAEHILTGDTAKRAENRTKYLLCELPREGEGMFPVPKVGNPEGSCVHVMGLDAAYKGKDNIELCDAEIRGRRIHIRSVTTIQKDNWVDGVTSEDIIAEVRGRYHALGAQMICVDTGQGIWLVQGLARPGSRVHSRGINFGAGPTKGRKKAKHYAATNAFNKRAEMHLDLQGLMEEGLITFDESLIKELSEVLPLITYDRKASGMVQIIKKDKIKAMIRGKSPDKLDAILLAIHAAILLSAE